MSELKKRILDHVSDPGYRPLRIKELARKIKIKSPEYRAFRRAVKELVASGDLARIRHGRIGVAEEESLLVGTLSVTRSGRGYVVMDDDSGEVAVPLHLMSGAIDGDQVEVRLTGRYIGGKPVAEVVKVTQRNRKQIVGNLKTSRYGDFLVPDDPRFKEEVQVSPPKGTKVESGMKVVVALDPWEDPYRPLGGKIIEVLGHPSDPGVDMLAIIHQHSLPTEFSKVVEAEAEKIPDEIPEEEIVRRFDLRKKTVFTIDPEDAKDFDDAVSLERTTDGYLLGVHIADVSYYVQAGSQLDKEAKARCFSAYLADRVLPMLPEKLSNEVCSLNPKVDRLTMSAFINLDKKGAATGYEIKETVINSKARLNYEQVQAFLDTGRGFEKMKRVGAMLKLMEPVARLLIEQRLRAGSLDLEQPEFKVRLDDQGRVREIVKKQRQLSNRLIEEFMLLANKVVAREFLSKNIPTLYRVHPPPAEEKIESFVTFARSLGFNPAFGSPPQAKLMARFMSDLRGRPEEELLTDLLIRSLQKAFYQPDNIGHFGLGFPHYLHFTSPIRRYPDLIVHRLLREELNGRYRPARAGSLKSSLARIGRHCLEQEINIMDAEMETLKAKQAEFLSRQLGEVFPGIISGMLQFGFFVRLLDVGAEGMVRLSSLHDDYYHADIDNHVVIGRRLGRRFRLGDRVMVQVVNVSMEAREIDLMLVEDTRKSGRAQKQRKKRRR